MGFNKCILFAMALISKVNFKENCGKDDGQCDPGECCSQYNWCGESEDHCGRGCQSKYSDACHDYYEECSDNLKTIMDNKGCIEYCGFDNVIYLFEFNNTCFDECPDNLKLIFNTTQCVESCINDNTNIFEYNNICYEECPNNTKLINEKKMCVDDCKFDDKFVYEYDNKCYEQCPNNNFFDDETKYCYDEIPEGYYCNSTQRKVIYKCHEDCKECNGPPINNNNNCLKCQDENKYINFGNCVDNCTNGYYYNYSNNNKICNCPDSKCLLCSQESNEINKCLSCNKDQGYYQKRDDIISDVFFFDCYKSIEGYYLSNELIFEKCYETCKSCISKGDENDNKCLVCSEQYISIKDFENKNNCYNVCEYNYYYNKSDNNKYKCTINNNCPENYSKFIADKKRCIDECKNDNIYKYEYNNKCYKTCPEGKLPSDNYLCKNFNKEEPLLLNMTLNFSGDIISLGYINSLNEEYLKQAGDSSKFVSKSSNKNLNIYIYKDSNVLEELDNEAPIINFGECYDKVKKYYNINEDLIITIINNETNKEAYGKSTNIYLFSFPNSGDPIDTTDICDENDKIIIKEDLKHLMEGLHVQEEENIYFLTKQGINVFNISDKFYNDLCFFYESPNNKDIPLKDRISSFFPNLTLCDPGCENKGVDLDKMKVKCECIFNNILSNEIINNLSGGFLTEIMNVLNSINIEVLKCFTNIYDRKYFNRAIGGFIIIGLFFMQLFCIFKYLHDKLYIIKKHIFSLSDSFFSYKEKNVQEPTKKGKIKSKNKAIIIKYNTGFKDNSTILNSKSDIKQNSSKLIINKFQIYNTSNLVKKGKNANFRLNTNNESDQYLIHLVKIKNYLYGTYDENDFLDVLDKETRTFCELFIKKFKNNQIIINTFCVNEIFKPREIKIILFILTIELYMIINALFYNEEYLSNLLNSDKKETFFSFVVRRINHFVYCSVVNIIITYIIGLFYMEEDKIKRIFIRYYKDDLKIKYELSSTIRDIESRFKLFIFFNIIISIFCFVYISCFNIVYPYIRMEWIISSIFIFIVMQLINLLSIFLGCCLRFISVKINSEKLFKLSLLLD